MSKTRKKIDTGQLSIFDIIKQVSEKQKAIADEGEIPGRLNIDAVLREMITRALKRSSLNRYKVAARMSELLGKEITKAQLDSWSAESKENHRFPLAYLPAFSEATADRSILRYIADLAGGYFIESEDALRLELGRIEEQKQKLLQDEKTIREVLTSLKS